MTSTTGDFVLYLPETINRAAYMGIVIGSGLLDTEGRWVWFQSSMDGKWIPGAIFIQDRVLEVVGNIGDFGISGVHLVEALGDLVNDEEWAKR